MLKRLLAALAASLAALTFAASVFAADLAQDGYIRGLCGTATASAGAATLANKCGVITSESISTAAAAEYTLTLTNTAVAATDICIASTGLGSSTTGTPGIGGVTPAAGSAVITVTNLHTSAAFNGTITVSYMCFRP